ncbi:exo-beta-N-acetylmuramidase NamZ domain-containing protein [Methylomonas sp. LL1]|uniref:exo-beta-N-acetylmuramidase NamZ domain-containing protein n=1 Tax=Methylomonas sp. LL1 TaxID=2785785 RepID=UPI0018C36C89|nr:exo-beta-N-acetylmuramidase NamZ domain-containing protein [Methylomonas sp. LL1]
MRSRVLMMLIPSHYSGLILVLLIAVIGAFWFTGCASVPPRVDASPPLVPELAKPAVSEPLPGETDSPRFARLTEAVQQEIAAGHLAGAVILVGQGNEIVYRKAFGHKVLPPPHAEAMTLDTIFDLASLTKVVATTTAILQLAERGSLALDNPVASYWPEFGRNGKERISLRQLLTHNSGLRAEVNNKISWSGYQGALEAIVADRPLDRPGTGFRYSDANFVALGEIVLRVSGLPLDDYCARNIFAPLGLKDTMFKPQPHLRSRVAPSGQRRAEVQDPTAYRMGGVAGHAGLFSTADDLAVFARMLLGGGMARGQSVLASHSVAALSSAYRIPGSSILRGLGWDIRSPYSTEHNDAFPIGSFGHTGYTGTSIWLAPQSGTFLIILTSRLYPDAKGTVKPLRAKAAAAVAAALSIGPAAEIPSQKSSSGGAANMARVQTGLDVLAASGFAPLAGKNIGIITNHTGLDAAGRTTIELLRLAPGIKLRAIFSPEHGLSGEQDRKIASGRDSASGLPVYSLYGDSKRPTVKMLEGLDALVYDIQDVGTRFYTYITTMAYAMEAAAAAGLDFYVLDRPNPINASMIQGPVMDRSLKSFTGYFPLPVRYGMTVGELAGLFNSENRIGAKLHVVPMQGYRRDTWFDQTGLPWVNPSPNIRSLTQALLYPGVALVESANLSVGRGTDTPFEIVGAPWISGDRLTEYLNRRKIPGLAFEAASFEPSVDRFRLQRCQGVRLRLIDRELFDGPLLGLELASALQRLYSGTFEIDRTLSMFGAREVLDAIKQGKEPQGIRQTWQSGLDQFRILRAKYLLY